MGLSFTVGNPSVAFIEPFDARVRSLLLDRFGAAVDLDSGEEYTSEELGWSGWEKLQRRATKAVGRKRVPYLLSMEAWCGCYVPAETDPGAFEVGDTPTPLKYGSLPRLVGELEAVGTALGLPTDDAGLRELADGYLEDDREDEDMDIETYAHLLLAARSPDNVRGPRRPRTRRLEGRRPGWADGRRRARRRRLRRERQP
jgi:hypothetical protein